MCHSPQTSHSWLYKLPWDWNAKIKRFCWGKKLVQKQESAQCVLPAGNHNFPQRPEDLSETFIFLFFSNLRFMKELENANHTNTRQPKHNYKWTIHELQRHRCNNGKTTCENALQAMRGQNHTFIQSVMLPFGENLINMTSKSCKQKTISFFFFDKQRGGISEKKTKAKHSCKRGTWFL